MKTIKIAGVRVTPKWEWSDQYMRDLRADAMSDGSDTNAKRLARAEAYARWYAEQHDIAVPPKAFVAVEADKVVFRARDLVKRKSRFWGTEEKPGKVLARVTIPNMDFVPEAMDQAA